MMYFGDESYTKSMIYDLAAQSAGITDGNSLKLLSGQRLISFTRPWQWFSLQCYGRGSLVSTSTGLVQYLNHEAGC